MSSARLIAIICSLVVILSASRLSTLLALHSTRLSPELNSQLNSPACWAPLLTFSACLVYSCRRFRALAASVIDDDEVVVVVVSVEAAAAVSFAHSGRFAARGQLAADQVAGKRTSQPASHPVSQLASNGTRHKANAAAPNDNFLMICACPPAAARSNSPNDDDAAGCRSREDRIKQRRAGRSESACRA